MLLYWDHVTKNIDSGMVKIKMKSISINISFFYSFIFMIFLASPPLFLLPFLHLSSLPLLSPSLFIFTSFFVEKGSHIM